MKLTEKCLEVHSAFLKFHNLSWHKIIELETSVKIMELKPIISIHSSWLRGLGEKFHVSIIVMFLIGMLNLVKLSLNAVNPKL